MSGSEIRHRERILEAIDQLRKRKARPDINRICNFMMRRFSVNAIEAKDDLQKCVDNHIVLKVEYKGSISYRNAAKKFSHLKRDANGQLIPRQYKPNRKFSDILTNAIAELIVQEPDYLELGVPESELIKNILSKDNVKYTRKYVSILLEKQVECGGLTKMENGHYLMGPSKQERSIEENHFVAIIENRPPVEKTQSPEPVTAITNTNPSSILIQVKPRKKPGPKPGFKREKQHENDDKKSDSGSLRVGGRRKRAKKVFDPSDNNLPKKRGRPAGSLNKTTLEKHISKYSDNESSRPESRASNSGKEQGGVCSVCHVQNKKGPNDRMVSCRECSNKAHYSCLNGDDMMLRMYPDNTWQCPHCKTCVVCYETSDAGNLIVCSVCADAYHTGCHQPRITDKVKNGIKWMCINCQMPDELAVNDIQSNMKVANLNAHTDDISTPTPSGSGNSSPSYRSPIPSPTPPTLSPQTNRIGGNSPNLRCHSPDSQSVKDLDLEENIDPSIPDASNWTYNQVYDYFAQYFPEEAKVFRDQEIDGHSLLLMKRIDVLTNLKLKLGPALKIYRHVVKLQVRRDDPKLYWL